MYISDGRSPNFWTRGLASLGLAGTRGPASPIEDILSFNAMHAMPTAHLIAIWRVL